MAKIRAKTRDRRAITTRPYGAHRVTIHAEVQRIAATPGGAFEACVQINRGQKAGRRGQFTAKRTYAGTHCSRAKNPRKALSAALRAIAKSVSARGGAFAGLKGS